MRAGLQACRDSPHIYWNVGLKLDQRGAIPSPSLGNAPLPDDFDYVPSVWP